MDGLFHGKSQSKMDADWGYPYGWETSKSDFLLGDSFQSLSSLPTKKRGVRWAKYKYDWLVLSTPLKNMSQLGLLFPIYGKLKRFQTTNQMSKWGWSRELRLQYVTIDLLTVNHQVNHWLFVWKKVPQIDNPCSGKNSLGKSGKDECYECSWGFLLGKLWEIIGLINHGVYMFLPLLKWGFPSCDGDRFITQDHCVTGIGPMGPQIWTRWNHHAINR